MSPVWWTGADAAELDVLLHELSVGFFEHRERCEACSPEPCPVLVSWNSHLEQCPACRGDAPLTFGPPCHRKRRFIDHGGDCVRCNPCPSLRLAIELVVQWREARELRSRAAWLRAERVRLEGGRVNLDCDHPEIADGRCIDCGVEVAEVRIVPVDDFAAVDEPGAEALVGDESNVVFAENGDAMIYGDGGAGKTTLAIDLAVHIAAGDDWLGVPIAQPRRVLVIENEGPRPLFRKKLARKVAGWQGSPLDGRVLVWESPWAEFTFADAGWRETLARRIRSLEVDVVIVGPITAAGMDEAGTLQEARAFNRLIREVRQLAGRDVLVIVIHHENKGGKVSGAWEGVGDTLIHVQAQGHGRTRLYFQKSRWASDYHATSLNLTWAPGEGFAVEEKDELDDDALGDLIVAAISERPGSGWTKIAQATPGVGKDRRNAVRDGLFAAGRIVNVDKDEGVIDRLIEAKAAHLYRGDDPVVRELRLDPAAVPPQPAAGEGETVGTATAACGSPIGAAGRSRSSEPPSEQDELDLLVDEVWRD